MFRVGIIRCPLGRLISPSHLACTSVRFATKKAGGTIKNSKDSAGRHLGLKVGAAERVKAGRILRRQRGTVAHAGVNVGTGRDHTLYALCAGIVHFTYMHTPAKKRRRRRQYINVVDAENGQTVDDVNAEFDARQSAHVQRLRDRRFGIEEATSRRRYDQKIREQTRDDRRRRFAQILTTETPRLNST